MADIDFANLEDLFNITQLIETLAGGTPQINPEEVRLPLSTLYPAFSEQSLPPPEFSGWPSETRFVRRSESELIPPTPPIIPPDLRYIPSEKQIFPPILQYVPSTITSETETPAETVPKTVPATSPPSFYFPELPARPDLLKRLAEISEKYFPTDLEKIIPREKVIPEEGLPLFWQFAANFVRAATGTDLDKLKQERDKTYLQYLDRVKNQLSQQGQLALETLKTEFNQWKTDVEARQKLLEMLAKKIPNLDTNENFMRAVMETYLIPREEIDKFIASRKRPDGTIDLGLSDSERQVYELKATLDALKTVFPNYDYEDLYEALKKGQFPDLKTRLERLMANAKTPEEYQRLAQAYLTLAKGKSGNVAGTIEVLKKNKMISSEEAEALHRLNIESPDKAIEVIVDLFKKQSGKISDKQIERKIASRDFNTMIVTNLLPGLSSEKMLEMGTDLRKLLANIKKIEGNIEKILISNASEKKKQADINDLFRTLEKQFGPAIEKFGFGSVQEFYDRAKKIAINALKFDINSEGNLVERIDRDGNSYARAMDRGLIPPPKTLQEAEERFYEIQQGTTVNELIDSYKAYKPKETKAETPEAKPTELKMEPEKIKEAIPNLPDKALSYFPTINEVSKQTGVNPALIAAVCAVESNFDENAKGSADEIGLMQVRPNVAASVGIKETDLTNPKINLITGALILRQLLKYFDNDLDAAIQAYNIGIGNYRKGKRNVAYLNKVKDYMDRFKTVFGEGG